MTRALFIGRFQPFHNAHLLNIRKILEEADEVIIAVGSSQEKNTLENPFSYGERKKMIEAVLKGNKIRKYKIVPYPDQFNDRKWTDYAKNNFPEYETIVSGNPWTLKCFRKFGSKVKKIKLVRGISSTKIREMIAENKDWKRIVPREIYDYIIKTKGGKRIRNIFQS